MSQCDQKRARMERREFLFSASRALSCVALLGTLSGCTVPIRSFRASLRSTVIVPLESYPELARDGGMVKVILGNSGRAVFVRRLSDGKYDSLSAVCTHQGCIVNPSGSGFRCPCHGSSYDRHGNNVAGPAPEPLEKFRVTANVRFVRIHLGEE